ncbi:hypothetical protein OSH39_19765 [Mycobacterium ulcerans]|uniref:Uncharacterized protein n=2 Tax=Mycobacterium ulcerans TaxID=1809 RepID=A0PQY2_MYCUA|nr:hypothetical protein [Mycobacterium ulcerans]ABL04751.1 conserved hypothetical protein [Mycobacterium ulcerans Agy99]MEB3906588.1 hypothetical protein [Mycobacterium ulcerans]MEB3910741.1 hypothetical protein [Mycobacterium ulcerans]MEB3920992.1 hypothetical protein [Mycobacterium ulcerans]MEB3925098.1 hypothetical protein [Mycobacterium ulcerans]
MCESSASSKQATALVGAVSRLRPLVVGSAMTVFVYIGLGLAGLALGAGTARADSRCDPICHGAWCPGEPVPWAVRELAQTWDMNVCHDFHQVSGGVYAEGPLPPDAVRCPPISFLCP